MYATKDGFVAIICVQEAHWQSLLGILEREDLKDDPRFANQALRAENEDIIDNLVKDWTKTISREEAAALLKEKRVPAAPVRNLEEVTSDVHMHQRGMLKRMLHPVMGNVVLPTSPIKFHESPEPNIIFEPEIGQHTNEILESWLGFDQQVIEQMRENRVIA